MERIFDLARPSMDASLPASSGQITSNSFMKREFGKKLIEEYLPNWDLTHLIDTSGAYIPGHGTPTVILFARAQAPRSEQVRGVLGIRGKPLRRRIQPRARSGLRSQSWFDQRQKQRASLFRPRSCRGRRLPSTRGAFRGAGRWR